MASGLELNRERKGRKERKERKKEPIADWLRTTG